MFAVVQNESMFAVRVFWPSAGINSMVIYTLTMLLFVQTVALSAKRKAIVFAIGAVGTFMANVLRIVAISITGLRVGTAAAIHFHDYYGEFFFIFWIILYLTVILYGQRIGGSIKLKVEDVFFRRSRSTDIFPNIKIHKFRTSEEMTRKRRNKNE